MAFLFVDSLAQNNSRSVQILGKILELLFLSVGLFSTLIVMKDYSCQIVFSSLMGFFTSIIKCLLSSPSFTIIISINLMVLLIFASSAFHRRRDADNHHHQTTLLHPDDLDHYIQIITHHESPPPPPPPLRDIVEVTPPPPPPSRDIIEVTPPPLPPPPPPSRDIIEVTPPPPPWPQPQETAPSSRKATIPIRNNTTSSHTLQSLFAPPPPPLPTAPPLEKWKDEEEETMEATWEAIMGGGKQKAKKKKQLKKSETWEAAGKPPPRRLDSEEVAPSSPKWKELRKAETFNDAVSVTRRGGLIRRDHSMSLEEFNQKVETFIKNFNDGMRLQRQESKKKFLGIINQKRF